MFTPPLLIADAAQVSFFRLCVRGAACRSPWRNGNIYAMPNIPNQIVPYPAEVAIDRTTVFDLYVSGDFEIRLFGDPVVVEGQQIPIQRLNFQLDLLATSGPLPVLLEQQLNVIPDFVDGWMFSVTQTFGIGLKSATGWWCTDSVMSSNQVYLVQNLPTSADSFLGMGGFSFRPIGHCTPSISNSSAYLYAKRSTSFRNSPQFHSGSQTIRSSNRNKWGIR